MDVEVVKELAAAFSQMGGDAKGAFIWYLVLTQGVSLICNVMLGLFGFFTVRTIAKVVIRAIDNEGLARDLEQVLGLPVGDLSLSYWNRTKVMSQIKEYYEKENQK